MKPAVWFGIVVIGCAVTVFGAPRAEAKTPTYLITGGELGQYAYHFFLRPDEESVKWRAVLRSLLR
jgi:hypothetical protein